jgi:hypothetical protein
MRASLSTYVQCVLSGYVLIAGTRLAPLHAWFETCLPPFCPHFVLVAGADLGRGSFATVRQAVTSEGLTPSLTMFTVLLAGTFVAVKQFPVQVNTPAGHALVQSAISEIQVRMVLSTVFAGNPGWFISTLLKYKTIAVRLPHAIAYLFALRLNSLAG